MTDRDVMQELRGSPDTYTPLVRYLSDRVNLSDSHVLDLGCGSGGVSEALSEHCQTLTVADIQSGSVRNGLRKSVLDRTDGAQLDAATLPFRDDTFDVAVVNGVLEWVPDASDDNPKLRQRQTLREINRVLSPNGILYLGIETRFYAGWLVGIRDHSGLPFAAPLPRPLTHLYSQLVRGRHYGNYLYTVTGYERLLGSAGFDEIDGAAALPTYKFPQEIIPLNDMDRIRRAIPNIDEPSWRRPFRRILAVNRTLFETFGTEVVFTARAPA